MLKGIDSVISPKLIKILMEMGHGDEIVIGDGNFPAANCAKRLIRLDGHSVPHILEAILKLMPLDSYSEYQVSLMEVAKGDDYVPQLWEDYKKIITSYEPINNKIEYVERFEFYDRARDAYAIVATGETGLYANIILKKGVVINGD